MSGHGDVWTNGERESDVKHTLLLWQCHAQKGGSVMLNTHVLGLTKYLILVRIKGNAHITASVCVCVCVCVCVFHGHMYNAKENMK